VEDGVEVVADAEATDVEVVVDAEVADDCATGVIDKHAAGTKASSHKYLPDTPNSAQLW
jgi:hypothetical protein